MKYRFTIPGRLRGLNDYIDACRGAHKAKDGCAGWISGARMKKKDQEWVPLCIMNKLRGVHIVKPVELHYEWIEKDRCRDLDNISGYGHKIIQDALVQCGVLKNDGPTYVVGFTDKFGVDRKHPRVEVEIEEMS